MGKSSEDYLEAILMLRQKNGYVRSVDLARHMGYSKASISHAVKSLCFGGYLIVDQEGHLCLTGTGQITAEKIYERHQFFMEQLISIGVDRETAERDACQMEHAISDISFQKLKEKALRNDRQSKENKQHDRY